MTDSEEVLLTCESELVHIPGFIQSHGFLVALDPASQKIQIVSENIVEYVNTDITGLSDKKITELLSAPYGLALDLLLNSGLSNSELETAEIKPVAIGNHLFEVIIHKNTQAIIIEFEIKKEVKSEKTLKRLMSSTLAEITSARTLQNLAEKTASVVQNLIGFDRVMIYKFHDDGHGEVISESKNQGLDPFLHLHYPASDIPAQARELYIKNPVRLIADAHAWPSPLVSVNRDITQPLDLTDCVLRAVSPIHIEYLKNMGVLASFSVSLLFNGQLWGLIACHNYESKPNLDYETRITCRFIGELFCCSIERCQEDDIKEEILKLDAAEHLLHDQMLEDFDIVRALTRETNNLLSISHCTGAALYYDNVFHTVGLTPAHNKIKRIVEYARENTSADLYETSALPTLMEMSQDNIDIASGILFISLFPGSDDYLIWFKPELIKTIDWAGNPDKAVVKTESDGPKLSPRKSFEKWSAEKRNHSEIWSKPEILAAVKLRNNTLAVQNRKLNDIRERSQLLQVAYDELDTFSFTISHDLRTPLAAIINYNELIVEEYGDEMPAPALTLIQKVLANSEKMTSLIKDVLNYSMAKKAGVKFVKIDMAELLSEVCEQTKAANPNVECVINFKNIIDVYGDLTMITQLFQNLIGNAVKYSSLNEHPVITVEAEPYEDNFILYRIKDNGVGFEMKDAHRIFELFERLDNVKTIEGTGMGLAIVKRLVEKNGGKIWAESIINTGSTFYITLMKELLRLPLQ